MIKSISISLFLLTAFWGYGQDIESRLFALNDLSLPQVNIVSQSEFYRNYANPSITDSFEVNASNYWKPVDMLAALSQNESYIHRRPTNRREITAESMGLVAPKPDKEPTVRFRVVPPGTYFGQRPYRIHNNAYQDLSLPVFNAHPRSRGYYPYY